jgi:prefoldin subunit 5
MDAKLIRENFEEQLKSCNENIDKLQQELVKLQEYRVKLVGGIETLDLLEKEEEETEDEAASAE